jgi:hypothetical protein
MAMEERCATTGCHTPSEAVHGAIRGDDLNGSADGASETDLWLAGARAHRADTMSAASDAFLARSAIQAPSDAGRAEVGDPETQSQSHKGD